MTDGWVGRTVALEIVGLTPVGFMLLQKDGHAPPDCRQCGRIRWRRAFLEENRDRFRELMARKYGPDVLVEQTVS